LFASLVLAAAASAEEELAAAGQNRQEKLFSVFNIIKFNNDVCMTTDGLYGTCYTEAECTKLGGVAMGSCASSFGVCCQDMVDNCAATTRTITMNNTYIASAGFPLGVSDGTAACATARSSADIKYTIKPPSNTVQMRVDFINFESKGPMMGACTNDSISITGIDDVSMKVLPSNLCGTLTGQHLYLSTKDSTSISITVKLAEIDAQRWQILLRFYEADQTALLAPRGCLQYFRETSGVVESMNYGMSTISTMPELLNDHAYAICIMQQDKYCDISLTSSDWMLGGTTGSCTSADDLLVIGTTSYCGSTFGSAQLNYTGQAIYNWSWKTAEMNTAMNDGFSLSYLLLPC